MHSSLCTSRGHQVFLFPICALIDAEDGVVRKLCQPFQVSPHVLWGQRGIQGA